VNDADKTSEPSKNCMTEGDEADKSWCEGCAFLHYFMLKVLPDALKSVERTADNADSLDNALEYITHAHEKFLLYQAHVMRVVNQGLKLDEYEQRLYNLCCEEQNEDPTHLWLVIDFKMKWEAMYARETTVKNFGKRGISWHGNRIHSYVWDKQLGKPVKIVAKVDQILEGSNKQDGITGLALVEAAQMYLHHEFLHAQIEYLQSDNAAAYHLKELVLGIPLLNAVSTAPFGTSVSCSFFLFCANVCLLRLSIADAEDWWTSNQEYCPDQNARWQELA
jgi:hypothetical protein